MHDEMGVTLRQHFDEFREANQHITVCPMCGISELKTEHDTTRDQYDHYIPKASYPFSSINFHNLVPTCKECNSFDFKGEKDVVAIRNTKLFYPYDQEHKGIDVEFIVEEDNVAISDIAWRVEFKSLDGKEQEIDAWKNIYNIEERYLGFVKGHIQKWFNAYWEYLEDDALNGLTEDQKKKAYFASLKADETECLNVIRKPALSEFIRSCELDRARQEAQYYT